MRRPVIALLSVLLVMGVLDAAWLATMIPRLYRPELGGLLAQTLDWLPAVVFYGLYAAGVSLFVVLPSLAQERGLARVGLLGAAFGLVAYGTYDLTNMATIDQWPLIITVVDMTWGAVLTAVVSVLAVWLTRRLS